MTTNERFDELIKTVPDLSAPSTVKFDRFNTWLAEQLGVATDKIWTGYVSKPGNLNVRFNQPGPLSKRPVLGVALLGDRGSLVQCLPPAAKLVRDGKFPTMVLVVPSNTGWQLVSIISSAGGVGEKVRRLFPHAEVLPVEPRTVTPPLPSLLPLPPAAALRSPAGSIAVVPLTVDPRVERMVRLAIASAPAVMLVGPPGTGKTTLLRQAIADIADDPPGHGFTRAPRARWVTPEESWTTRELVGGETIDEHSRLRFRPGHVLDAIASNEWLVLDEANRADMDKIFGGLLTWLSGQQVELGKTSTALKSAKVTLAWTDTPESRVTGLERLASDEDDGPLSYRAGREWRLLGTYNAVDAQRVFRFGQALGRRFVRVPIPPMAPEDFEAALEPQTTRLTEDSLRAIVSLYSAHYADPATQLGPALFFWIQDYLRVGLELEVGSGKAAPNPAALLTEAYLTAAGTWLARLDEGQLEELRSRIPTNIIPDAEWSWLTTMLPFLG